MSIVGSGSKFGQTKNIIKDLPKVFEKFDITSMLDLPCGDFFWMKHINFDNIRYIGGDDSKKHLNAAKKHENKNIKFKRINILTDKLPKVDLIFLRDLFVHMSFEEINIALKNIYKSKSKYILTTTFTKITENIVIQSGEYSTSKWRPINFEVKPFHFPKPLYILIEGCTQVSRLIGRLMDDKSLGLWIIDDIK